MNDWAHHATAMIGKAELKRLSARSDAAGLLHLAGHRRAADRNRRC